MNNKITFPRLATLLADKSGRSKRFSEDFLREFFALISERLEANDSVKIKGLGTFRLSRVEPRRSVDVTTGEPMEISGHSKVVFIPSKELAEAVNAPFEAFTAIEISDDADIDQLFTKEDLPADEATENVTYEHDFEIEPDKDSTYEESAANEESVISFFNADIASELDEGELEAPPYENAEVPSEEEFEEVEPPYISVSETVAEDVRYEYERQAGANESQDIEEINKNAETHETESSIGLVDETNHVNVSDHGSDNYSDKDYVSGMDAYQDLRNRYDDIEQEIKENSEDSKSGFENDTNNTSDAASDVAPEIESEIESENPTNIGTEDLEESEELEAIGSRKRNWVKGLMIGLGAAAVALFATFAIWYVFATHDFSSFFKRTDKTASADSSYGFVVGKEAEKENAAVVKPAVLADSIDDTIPESESEEATEEVPTAPSDAVVYDTIGTTRYLTTMAKTHYGNYNLWPYIYEENKSFLRHPDRIRPGTPVVIPKLSKYGVDPSKEADIEKAKKLGVEIYARYGKKI